MEENPEELKQNENSQEPEQTIAQQETVGNTVKTTNINKKLIAIIAVLAIIIVILLVFIGRSPKATVKDVAKAVGKVDPIGLVDLVDPVGVVAFVSCYDYSDGDFDFDDFEEKYEALEKNYKKVEKEIKKAKFSVNVTNTKKVSDCKKLTKVTCSVKVKYAGEEVELKGIEVYTMKKGLKNYIVGVDPESIEDLEDQVERQEDELYDMIKELQDKIDLDDLEDVMS